MSDANHYQTLGVSQEATQTEIKYAYRRLAKRFHPDTMSESANHQQFVVINAAYEILGDPKRRRCYDQQVSEGDFYNASTRRQQRTAQAQNAYQKRRKKAQQADTHRHEWLQQVYSPINRLMALILNSLDHEIEELAADPFDDQLMEAFQEYIKKCQNYLNQARLTFTSQPNPTQFAGVAAHIYYCLNHISDGIEELETFTLNYDDYYLHTGKELFRIAQGLRIEAHSAVEAYI